VVESEPGQGTRLSIFLPRAKEDALAISSAPETPEVETGSERILLVEDDPMLNEMTATLLRQLGYRVLATLDGDEALTMASRLPSLDLVIADLVLPTKSGVEVADLLQEARPELRVLFISGYAHEIDPASDIGPTRALLAKPYTRADLGRAVRALLDRPASSPRLLQRVGSGEGS
jgi:CheY-like chemotaxis protein